MNIVFLLGVFRPKVSHVDRQYAFDMTDLADFGSYFFINSKNNPFNWWFFCDQLVNCFLCPVCSFDLFLSKDRWTHFFFWFSSVKTKFVFYTFSLTFSVSLPTWWLFELSSLQLSIEFSFFSFVWFVIKKWTKNQD